MLLHPHSSIPYIRMGCNVALYTVILLSRVSYEVAVSDGVFRGEGFPDILKFLGAFTYSGKRVLECV